MIVSSGSPKLSQSVLVEFFGPHNPILDCAVEFTTALNIVGLKNGSDNTAYLNSQLRISESASRVRQSLLGLHVSCEDCFKAHIAYPEPTRSRYHRPFGAIRTVVRFFDPTKFQRDS